MRRIDSQIFNTPTGRMYDPSESIARSANRTQEQVYGIMEREHQRQKANEDAFNQIYSNLGVIEGELRQKYDGAGLEAVQGTVDFVKQANLKGLRPNDPEFRSELIKRTSAIRSITGKADNIIKQVNAAITSVKDDPHIDWQDKVRLSSELMGMAANKDVLISPNQFDATPIVDKYINPNLVFSDTYKKLPSTGVVESLSLNERGDLVSRTVAGNSLLNKEKPLNDDGTVNLDFKVPELLDMARTNTRLASMAERIRKEKYSSDPYDIGTAKAVHEGLTRAASLNMTTQIKKTASDIAKEEAAIKRTNALTDASIASANLSNAKTRNELMKGIQDEKDQENFERMYLAWEQNNSSELKNYEKIGRLEDIQFENPREDFVKSNPDLGNKVVNAISSFENWVNTDKATKEKIYKNLGLSLPWLGYGSVDNAEQYNKVKSAFDEQVPNTRIASYNVSEGSSDGVKNWRRVEVPVNDPEQLKSLFFSLEANRGANKPLPEANTPKNTPTGTAAKFNPK